MAGIEKLSAFLEKVSADGKLNGRTVIKDGKIDIKILQEMGLLVEYENSSEVSYDASDNGFDINSLLNKTRKQSKTVKEEKQTKNNVKVNENGSKAVSHEKISIKGRRGILVRFEDGSLEFNASSKNQEYRLKFNNEEDFKANRPSKLTEGPRISDSRKFTRTTQYEYHKNGKLKQEKQTLDEDGKLLKIGDYDERGGLVSQKKYDKDGNLLESSTGKWEDENTHVIDVKDKEGKPARKIVDKLNDNCIESRTVYDKNNVKSEESFYKNGKLSNKNIYYPNGKLRRVAEFFETGGYKSLRTYDKTGKELQNYVADMVADGKTWDKSSAQVGEGDCYLVASVNAIRGLTDGDEMLSSLIDIKTGADGKKTYTVTLPGALIAAKGLAKDKNINPNKMYITGTYTFTEEEFNKIVHQQGSQYSLGNANIVLLEAAFEKFREEVSKTVKANNINPVKNMTIPGLYTTGEGLAGGVAYDAVFMLTGKPSKVYNNKSPEFKLERSALQNGEIKLVSSSKDGMVKAAPSSVVEMTEEQSHLNAMLDEIKKDIKDGKKDVIATVGFQIYNSETGRTTGHALTILDVTDKTVTITNPWYPDRTLTMSREDFIASADMVTICDASKDSKIREQNITVKPNKNNPQNENRPNPPKLHPDNNHTLTPRQQKQTEKQIKDLVKNWDKHPQKKIDPETRRNFDRFMNIVSKENSKENKPSKNDANANLSQKQQNEKKIVEIYNRLRKK